MKMRKWTIFLGNILKMTPKSESSLHNAPSTDGLEPSSFQQFFSLIICMTGAVRVCNESLGEPNFFGVLDLPKSDV